MDSYRTSFRQINDPGGLGGRSEMDRCAGAVATEALAEQCGGRHRPRSFTYYGFEPRLDFSHNLFGIENDAVIGFRYHEEDQKRRQYRDGNPLAQSLGWAKANGSFREDIRIDVEAKSYYAQNTFYLGDWSLTPGVRVEDVKVKTRVLQADGKPANSSLTNNQTEVLPGFGVAWNGIENTTIFAGVHKGFAPPRPSRDLDDADISKTKPEESTNWELGVRSSYFKGVTFESTLFHTDFDEIVIEDGGRFFNAGESKQSGLELAGRIDFGTIYNTAHNFYVLGSYTNLFTAKFTKDVASEGIEDGNRMPYAPHDIASLSFGYQHPVGLDARIGIDYVGQQHSDGANTRVEDASGMEGTIPSYTLLNASVRYKPVGSNATFFLSGYNLADKEYLASRVDGKVAGRDRQVFGGIRYDF